MNIPDEYWTTEVPTECGPYMMRIDNGEYVADSVVNVIGFHWEPGEPRKIVIAGGDITPQPVPREAKFCRLAPAAEVEKMQVVVDRVCEVRDRLFAERDALKAENEKLRELVHDAYAEGEQDGRRGGFGWVGSVTKSEVARLEGRSE